ncbi:MAG: hypothetical protein JJU27_03420 [Gammaproteobacteria bacterium]|nr:hypothetical protein [Gammaproteobacteria bacterium]
MPAWAEHTPGLMLLGLLLAAGPASTAAEEAEPDETFLLYLAAWDDAMQLELVEAAQARHEAAERNPGRRNEDKEDDDA